MQNYRHKKIGTILLDKVEQEVKAMGVKTAWTYTFDFQAKGFYQQHGYNIFGVLDDCPTGHKSYFLKKNL